MGFKKTIPLNEFITLQRGFDLPKDERIAGNVPVIASTGIGGYHNETKVNAPGVVIGRSGSIGGGQYITVDFWPLNTTLWVKDFKGHHPRYVYYLLKSIDFSQFNVGSGVPTLNRNHLSGVLVANTSYKYEKKIADIIGSLDDRIEFNKKINQTLEQMAQALFKSWFVDFDPVIDNALEAGNPIPASFQERAELRQKVRKSADFKPLSTKIRVLFPAEFEETELGWVPKGWKISTVGEELVVKGGSTPSTTNPDFWDNGIIHWTSPKDLTGNNSKILLDTSKKITDAGLKKISSGLLPLDTVLMSSRAPIGYLALAKIPLAINQGYIAIPSSRTLTPEYIIYWLENIMDEIKGMAGGTTFAEISKTTFKTIKLLVPTQQLTNEYTKIIKANFEQIASNLKQTNTLTQLRDTLLPKLISGELSLDDLPEAINEAKAA